MALEVELELIVVTDIHISKHQRPLTITDKVINEVPAVLQHGGQEGPVAPHLEAGGHHDQGFHCFGPGGELGFRVFGQLLDLPPPVLPS